MFSNDHRQCLASWNCLSYNLTIFENRCRALNQEVNPPSFHIEFLAEQRLDRLLVHVDAFGELVRPDEEHAEEHRDLLKRGVIYPRLYPPSWGAHSAFDASRDVAPRRVPVYYDVSGAGSSPVNGRYRLASVDATKGP